MSEQKKENFNQKVILALLANPEFIKACDNRATNRRERLPFVISESLGDLVGFMGLDVDS